MKIRWLGHSCFELTTDAGTVAVTDPFDASVGYPRPGVKADIVTTSHDHFDHNCLEALDGADCVASRTEQTVYKDLRITPFASFHDDRRGAKRGANVVYVFEADGQRVVHLGDLGHMPDETLLRALKAPDALLVPVGGVFTIDGTQAAKLAQTLKPRVIVAMHFKTPELSFALADETAFVNVLDLVPARLNAFELTDDAPALVVPTL